MQTGYYTFPVTTRYSGRSKPLQHLLQQVMTHATSRCSLTASVPQLAEGGRDRTQYLADSSRRSLPTKQTVRWTLDALSDEAKRTTPPGDSYNWELCTAHLGCLLNHRNELTSAVQRDTTFVSHECHVQHNIHAFQSLCPERSEQTTDTSE